MMRLAAAIVLSVLSALAGPAIAGSGMSPRVTYVLRCAGCHGMEGLGTETGGVPGFPGSVAILANDEAGRTYVVHVPGVVGSGLTDSEIAAVMNYVVGRWGETAAPAFTPEEVTRRRAEPVPDVVAYRRALAERLAAEGTPLAPYPWP